MFLRSLKRKTYNKIKMGGSNNGGSLVVYNRGSYTKQKFKHPGILNFFRGIVEDIEFNSYQSCFTARVYDYDFKKHFYTIATNELIAGSLIKGNYQTNIKAGNRALLLNIPVGVMISNVGFKGMRNTKIFAYDKKTYSKAAGCFSQVIQKNKETCLIKLASGSIKEISVRNFATIGFNSNTHHNLINLRKAGRSRWLNKRPSVRGVAMNPSDHPHGGGEGKSSVGRKPVSAWCKPIQK